MRPRDLQQTSAAYQALYAARTATPTRVQLGCGCEVRGRPEHDFVNVERFTNFCMRHVMTAKCKRAHGGGYAIRSTLMRQKQPGHLSRWYVVATGEAVTEEAFDAYVRDVLTPVWSEEETWHRDFAARERHRGELYLFVRGWAEEERDAWTAPEAVRHERQTRWGQPLDKYVRIPFGYAVNVQKQEDRMHGLHEPDVVMLMDSLEEAERRARR